MSFAWRHTWCMLGDDYICTHFWPCSQWGKLFLSELDPKLVFLLFSFRLYARSNLPFQIDHADVQKLMQLKGIFIHVGQQPHQTRILIFLSFSLLAFILLSHLLTCIHIIPIYIPAQQQRAAMRQRYQQYDQQILEQRKNRPRLKLDDFHLLRTLGTGSFGRVHLSQSRHNGRYYAIKVLKKTEVVRLKQGEMIDMHVCPPAAYSL